MYTVQTMFQSVVEDADLQISV